MCWTQFHLLLLLSSTLSLDSGWPPSYQLEDGEEFDIVVVGAGSGGAAAAARLAARWRVLLLEAGGDPPLFSVIPSMFPFLHHSAADWDYRVQLPPGTGEAHENRTIFLARGKGLGGSSSTNYHIYARGVPQDFVEWGRLAPGWDWDTVLQYYKKSEGMTDPSVLYDPDHAHLHSVEGPVLISRPKPNPLFREVNEFFLKALEGIGVKRVLENNGPEIFGAATPHFTFANGRRSSTAEAYLRPLKDSPNLKVTKYATVVKILIDPDDKIAYGVEIQLNSGKKIKAFAKIEVVLAAGAIETPKILMLSGVGPEEVLKKHDIDVIVASPVGENLFDHLFVPIAFQGDIGLQTAINNLAIVKELDAYPTPIQCGYFKVNNTYFNLSESKPHFQIFNIYAGSGGSLMVYFTCKFITNYDDAFCNSLATANAVHELFQSQVVLLHPKSRGRVRLRGRDPLLAPAVELALGEADVAALAAGARFAARLGAGAGGGARLRTLRARVPGCDSPDAAAYWRCYARAAAGSLQHPAGSCAMGARGQAVVDARLRVHGVARLRLADVSIMPAPLSGNTNAPSIMVGERAADFILEEYGNDTVNNKESP